MESILTVDQNLFLFINTELVWKPLDILFVAITTRWFGILAGSLLSLLAIYLYRREGLFTFILAVIVVVLTDRIICDILKPLIARPRPPWVLENVRLLVGVTQAGSFPSAHAGNHFALFVVFLLRHRWLGWIYLPVAILVAYSRVYVGVHYPLDIIGGAVFGSAFGYLMVVLFRLLMRRFKRVETD